MAIIDNQSLQAAVVNWMARSDITSNVQDCIQLAEAYFNRRLRVRQQENVVELSPTDGSVTIPGDYLAWRRLTFLGPPERDLEFVVPSALTRQYPTLNGGIPQKFTIESGFINLRPVDPGTLEFNYFAKIPPLTAPEDTNWLLDAYPDFFVLPFSALQPGATVN